MPKTMPTKLTTEALVTLTAAPADGEGDGPRQLMFAIDAYNGGVMRPAGFFGQRVVIDLKGLRAAEPIAALLDHHDDQIVGQSTEVSITEAGIVIGGIVTGDINEPNDPAHKVVSHSDRGFQWKASVGLSELDRVEEVEAGVNVTVNGQEFTGPLFVVRAGTLDEVSFLSVSADKNATAKLAGSPAHEEISMEFHDWLKANKFDPANLEDEARDVLLKTYTAERKAEKAVLEASAAGKTLVDDPLRPIKEKQKRISAIRSAAARVAEEAPEYVETASRLLATALAEDWTPERFELEWYRELKSGPVIDNRPRASGRETPVDGKVLEAAMCQAGRLADVEKQYDERTLEAASSRFKYGLGLNQLLFEAARQNGAHDVNTRDVSALLQASFPAQPRMQAGGGPSTYDVSSILSNVANKFILQWFLSVDSTAVRIAAIRPVSDFKQITSFSLTGDFTYQKIAPGGEIKHGTLGEQSYTNQADTFGRMFAIDRRDIINDDLNAFLGVNRRLGRGGALALNHEFWTVFLPNTAFFTAARNNFDDGVDSALDLDGLASAEVMFMEQTDPDGTPSGVLPAILLVPPGKKRTALQLMNSTSVVVAGDTDRDVPNSNTFQNDFKVESSPYMSNSNYSGSSALKWYLLANPNDMPVIEIAFLNGVERPTVENAQADFSRLGIQLRGFFDFGVAMQESRGGVAMKGEV